MARELKLTDISPLITEDILHIAANMAYKKKYTDNVPEIKEYSIKSGSGKADGMVGVLFRITIKYKNEKNVSVIGKGMPQDPKKQETSHCIDFFAKECLFFNQILLNLRNFEKEKYKGESFLLVPDCYYAFSDGKHDYILMEDLLEDGFTMPNQAQGLNVIQTTALFQLLGNFHGVSLAMKYLEPEKFNQLLSVEIIEPIYRDDLRLWYENYLLKISDDIIESITSHVDSEYINKFKNFTNPNTYWNFMKRQIENRDTECVINHGDAWATNFMFDDKTRRCKAIDFQLLRYNSPMIDISTALFACTTSDVRNELGGVKGILDIYACAMHQTMTTLGAPQYAMTTEQLHKLWFQFGSHGIGVALEMIPLSFAENEEVERVDTPGTLLEDFAECLKIKSMEGKKRLIDMISLAVDEGII